MTNDVEHRYIYPMEIFHTLNRGVDKRQIFMDKQDHLRFIHDLYEFNDKERVESTYYKFRGYGTEGKINNPSKKLREPLVDILAFCLMPNHYHLMISPKAENGIPQFMKKLNAGYAKYFNQKYERSGALFQGRFKRIMVTDNTHFLYLPFYIHFNPLDLAYPEWRENEIKDADKALEFLKSYRWSSHLDYWGIKNYPSVINRDFLVEIFGNSDDYRKMIKTYMKDIQIDSETSLE